MLTGPHIEQNDCKHVAGMFPPISALCAIAPPVSCLFAGVINWVCAHIYDHSAWLEPRALHSIGGNKPKAAV
jgi:hypothetical protein